MTRAQIAFMAGLLAITGDPHGVVHYINELLGTLLSGRLEGNN